MTTTFLKSPPKSKAHFSSKFTPSVSHDQVVSAEGRNVRIVFVPEKTTPLDQYRANLIASGMDKKHVDEIIKGLAESPLYEGQTSNA